jgi:energy-coupling factor transporter transmembrane protein EcfT
MKRRWILFAVLVFALLAFVPVVNVGAKMGWIRVWMAYPFVLVSGLGIFSTKGFVALFAIIGLHVGLSVSIGIGLDRLIRRIEPKRTSNQVSDATSGSGAEPSSHQD